MENEDFMLVPADAWHRLLGWYGAVEGQPALERKVMPTDGRQPIRAQGAPPVRLTACVCVCV